MIQAGTGKSNHENAFSAGQEACKQAISKINNSISLILVFSTPAYNQEDVLNGVKAHSKEALVVGCSAAGEITNEGVHPKHVVAMALSAPDVEFSVGIGKGAQKDSFTAGKEAAEMAKKKAKKPFSLFVMLLDGLSENGAAAVRGAQEVLGKNFPIMGGSAGDDFLFEKTYQYYNDKVSNNTVVGIGISGDFSFGVGVRHGWQPIGLPMKVTSSKGAVLTEVDNRPALSIYQDYFGKEAEELTKEPIAKMAYTYPLGMSVKGSPEFLIRDVVIANEKGEITCAAEIPQGSEIRLMLGDREKAIEAAREAAKQAISQLNGKKPAAIIVFNCIARQKLLGLEANKEIEAIQEVLGEEVPLIGFYTYGEIAPLSGKLGSDCLSVFHNETMAILVLGEQNDG